MKKLVLFAMLSLAAFAGGYSTESKGFTSSAKCRSGANDCGEDPYSKCGAECSADTDVIPWPPMPPPLWEGKTMGREHEIVSY